MSLRNLIFFLAFWCLLFPNFTSAQPGHFFLRDTFCSNQLVIVGNQVFDASNPMGVVVLPGAAFTGGDSTVHVELKFNQPKEVTLNASICEGDTIWVNGTPYHANFYIGDEVVQEGAANGCDSIIHVNLTVTSKVSNINATICEGDTIYVNGHVYDMFHTEGVEVIQGVPCDSIIYVNITAITPPFSEVKDTLCPNDFLLINGTRYDQNNRAGYEIIKNGSYTGCDSIVAIDLEFRNLWVYVGEDQEIIRGDFACIEAQYGLEPVELVWLPYAPCSDSACTEPCFRVVDPITFSFIATDVSGCVLIDDIRITISNKNRVYAANVFSPDAAWPNNYFYLGC
ncbi:MAG: hypothetical protein JNJ57_14800, partial [Saprospiraceae bacterium]|nr:hypothetical protein [Saprospiraceae bacterium]